MKHDYRSIVRDVYEWTDTTATEGKGGEEAKHARSTFVYKKSEAKREIRSCKAYSKR